MTVISVYNQDGAPVIGEQLSLELERKQENKTNFATAIRVLLQNWRQGTVGCKTRGQLAFSNKKPWRQKGTGRARVSSIRSPLWRKGGVIFGPQMRVRELDMNAQQRRLALNNTFFAMLDKESIKCLDFVLESEPSTKRAALLLKKLGVEGQRVTLFLPFNDAVSEASFRNIPGVTVVYFDGPNVFHLSNSRQWLFLKRDSDLFKKMVLQWS